MPAGLKPTNHFFTLAIAMLLAGNSASCSQATEIEWIDSPEKAARMSRQLNLPVVMYVTSDHCGYCRQMERQVWTNRDIVQLVDEGFVPLKIQASRHSELVARLGVHAFPTTILFSTEAKPLGASTGYLNPAQLVAMLRDASSPSQQRALKVRAVSAKEAPGSTAIEWKRSPREALLIARQSRLPILAYVSSEQCVYCRKMEAEVWTDPDMLSLVRDKCVPLALKAETDAAVIAALNVRSYPTTILLSAEGKAITGLAGYAPASGIAELLQRAAVPDTRLGVD